ncbi:uncharacterized protein [Malus domestica]|uniref:uncharacterized protein n=1 Tax=Malus domestica TaxID=3750 RepID=UPI0039770C20
MATVLDSVVVPRSSPLPSSTALSRIAALLSLYSLSAGALLPRYRGLKVQPGSARPGPCPALSRLTPVSNGETQGEQKSVSKPNPFETNSPKPGRADANHNHETAATAKKKKNKLGPNAVAMKHQVPLKPNPFETIWSRRKFDILGKKRKGEERRVGLFRSRAIETAKSTLLKEYEQSNKASVFVDKRIGEHNDELNEFHKAIRRAQREHQIDALVSLYWKVKVGNLS